MSQSSVGPRLDPDGGAAPVETDALLASGASQGHASVGLLAPAASQDNRVLANIEARLTGEVRVLIRALCEFAGRTQAISKDVPASAQFCKAVTGLFPLMALQVAEALQRSSQRLTFADDGAVYLNELGLQFEDLFRQITLDDRKFLAVAFVDKGGCQVLDDLARGKGGADGGHIHVGDSGCEGEGVENHHDSTGVPGFRGTNP